VVTAAGCVLLSTPSGWLSGPLHLNPDGTFAKDPREPLSLEPLGDGAGFLVRRVCDEGDPRARVVLRLRALGQDRAEGVLGRQEFRFTQRHSEILVILAGHPEGLTEEELMVALYGKACSGVTVRAEISRLRRILGPLVQTRPYRLATEVRADFLEVERLLAAGRDEEAARLFTGPLLPSSTAPAIVGARRRLASSTASCTPRAVGPGGAKASTPWSGPTIATGPCMRSGGEYGSAAIPVSSLTLSAASNAVA
jgi:hypothetical protein